MSDIKSELTGRLDEAKGRYEDARKEYENARHEVELLAGLIAEFERLTAQDTRAFPAVPPAVPHRPHVSGEGWSHLVGKRVKVTYNDEHAHVGTLTEAFDAWITIQVGKDTFSPAVDAVASVVPFPEQPAPASSDPAGPTPLGQIIAEHPLNATRPDQQEAADA